MSSINGRLGARFDVGRHFSTLAFWTCVVAVVGLSSGCERQQHDQPASEAPDLISQDLIWSFMINDSAPNARIRKWTKPKLWGLMIVDQGYASFYQQFAPLLRQAGVESGIQIDVCNGTLTQGEVRKPLGPTCERASFDFYFVITDGDWTEAEWSVVQRTLQGRPGELLVDLRKVIAAVPGGEEHTCRSMLGFGQQASNEIEHALAIIDSKQSLALGKCGTYLSLNMLGLYPFDGPQPLDPIVESETLAGFLLKSTPYGAEYLLKILYSPAVAPGMEKAEFLQTLPE